VSGRKISLRIAHRHLKCKFIIYPRSFAISSFQINLKFSYSHVKADICEIWICFATFSIKEHMSRNILIRILKRGFDISPLLASSVFNESGFQVIFFNDSDLDLSFTAILSVLMVIFWKGLLLIKHKTKLIGKRIFKVLFLFVL
jgi:hypothetical protein